MACVLFLLWVCSRATESSSLEFWNCSDNGRSRGSVMSRLQAPAVPHVCIFFPLIPRVHVHDCVVWIGTVSHDVRQFAKTHVSSRQTVTMSISTVYFDLQLECRTSNCWADLRFASAKLSATSKCHELAGTIQRTSCRESFSLAPSKQERRCLLCHGA